MLKFSKILFLPQFPKCSIHLTSVVLDDFYSILGVNPKSTQAQIKEAYYKLSKMYHPDMNQVI